MTEIFKDGTVMVARDNNQLAAFLNNGWKIKNSDIPKSEIPIIEKEELPFSDSDITFEERTEQKQYTKTEIQRMSTAELQALAAEVGIEDAFETSGNELKKKLMEHFGL